MHRWWVFLHIAGVFGFLMAHGVSVYATFQVGRERDPARVKQVLELSASSAGFMWNSMGALLIGGVAAGFTGDFWGQGWIWAAIVVLLAVIAAMYALATGWAARLRTIATAMAEGTEAVSQEQFEGILRSRRPHAIAAVGFAGLLVILYLMIFKPSLGLGSVPECPPSRGTAVSVCAFDDQRFVPERLGAPADSPFQISFANRDAGIEHNVAIYADESAEESFFVGDLIVGDETRVYDVPAMETGTYYFRCDVHPQMDGTLEVT